MAIGEIAGDEYNGVAARRYGTAGEQAGTVHAMSELDDPFERRGWRRVVGVAWLGAKSALNFLRISL